MSGTTTVTSRLGAAIAAGVPVLVLVSMGPVAALTGAMSIAVWGAAAVVGFLMALAFAELASSHPGTNGGVAVLAAEVLRPRSPMLARIAQWSYWFGWSPALAVNALLAGAYARQLFAPTAPAWVPLVIATAILVASVSVNHLGMTVGGRLQLVLVVCVASVIVTLFGGAALRGRLRLDHLTPFQPPGGWLSGAGWVALAGGMFMAAWSAYGSELALAYATRYRRGVRDAVGVLAAVAAVSVVAFVAVPFLLVVSIGADGAARDPAEAFTMLSRNVADGASVIVLGVLVLALLLGLNMIAIGSSWTLHQMAQGGAAPAFLGRLNAHGMPANALRFDLCANVGLLLVVTLLDGDTAQVPVALLAAANVGYLVSMCLALVAYLRDRHTGAASGVIRLRPGLARLVPALILLNIVLLAAAGQAWGWRNVGIGAVVLAAATALGSIGTKRSIDDQPSAPVVLPGCWGRAGAAQAQLVESGQEAR